MSEISTGVGGATIDPRDRTWTLSTAESVGVRSYFDSTANYTQKHFYSTGMLATLTSTMMALNQVTNFTSGSSGFSFNVAAGRIFRVMYFNASLTISSGANLWCDISLRVDASTAGTTGTDTPVFYRRLTAESPSSAAIAGGDNFGVADLQIDIPSSGSFGISCVSNSSVNTIVTVGFGGKEYLL